MKPKPQNPIEYNITNADQPAHIPHPKDVPTQFFTCAFDTMQVISTLRLRIEKTGLEISPASAARVQTVAETIHYMIDLQARAPHPLRDIPEITNARSQTILDRTD